MPFTAEQQEQFMETCYGCNINDLIDEIKRSMTYKASGKEMVLLSLLSDAQEMLVRDQKERVRKQLNIVKHLICELPVNDKGC
jgi:hypothetical protein